MGLSTAAYLAIGAFGGAALSTVLASKPSSSGGGGMQAAVAPPASQAAKAPDASSVAQGLAGNGQSGGSPGVASTFLSGPGGIDPSLLQLGRQTLLGG